MVFMHVKYIQCMAQRTVTPRVKYTTFENSLYIIVKPCGKGKYNMADRTEHEGQAPLV